jgi:hypothetical protein
VVTCCVFLELETTILNTVLPNRASASRVRVALLSSLLLCMTSASWILTSSHDDNAADNTVEVSLSNPVIRYPDLGISDTSSVSLFLWHSKSP